MATGHAQLSASCELTSFTMVTGLPINSKPAKNRAMSSRFACSCMRREMPSALARRLLGFVRL